MACNSANDIPMGSADGTKQIHGKHDGYVTRQEKKLQMFNNLLTASSLGAAITLPVCGFLIITFGWESVFYSTGVVGVVWSCLWFALIHDSPAQHPRISDAERKFIEDAIGNTSSRGKVSWPWP